MQFDNSFLGNYQKPFQKVCGIIILVGSMVEVFSKGNMIGWKWPNFAVALCT